MMTARECADKNLNLGNTQSGGKKPYKKVCNISIKWYNFNSYSPGKQMKICTSYLRGRRTSTHIANKLNKISKNH